MEYDVVITGGYLVDPAHGRQGHFDLGLTDGAVAAVSPALDPARARRRLDAGGCWLLPGAIDLHVHTSRRHGGQNAHRMLARAGICTAVDMGGPWEEFLEFALSEGAGLNFACLEQVRPGLTVRGDDPRREELESLCGRALEAGAVGLKLLGGHYPLTPAASRLVLEVANAARVYVAFHAGSTATGSNLAGFREAVALCAGLRVHLPHVNSYCRGQLLGRALDEILEALKLLESNRQLVSESYLAAINGTSGRCLDGVPESHATRQCLRVAGYAPTEAGLEAAINDGFARVNLAVAGENINITGAEAVRSWRGRGTVTSVNFPVNPPESRLLAATLRGRDGRFIVDALASDGGGHPRNVTIERAMGLVRMEALTPADLVLKTALAPAQLLGLAGKGHLGEGADADITAVETGTGVPRFTVVGGRLSYWHGAVVGSGTTVLTTEHGLKALARRGVRAVLMDPAAGALYAGRPAGTYDLPAATPAGPERAEARTRLVAGPGLRAEREG